VNHQIRHFARSSVTPEEPEDKAKSFVMMVGYDENIANGVVKALKQAGVSGEALLSMVRSMAGRWEVGEDEGLEALVGSVEQTIAQSEGREIIKVWCVPPQAWLSGEEEEDAEMTSEQKKKMMERAFLVEALEGTTLTDVAKFGEGTGASTLGEYIECACSGIMACSTCHVVIEPEWFHGNKKTGPPCEDERDMIDLAFSPRSTSRLGCQILLTKELNGIVIKIPKDSNNLMDHVPF